MAVIHTCNKRRGSRFRLGLLLLVLLLIAGGISTAVAAPPDYVFLPPTTIDTGGTPPYDAYSAWAYTWDRDYNALLNPVDASMNGIANLLMLCVVLFAKFTIKIVLAAFSTNLVVQFSESIAMPFVGAMKSYLWDEWAVYFIGLAGMIALLFRLKQETTRAWGTILSLLAVLIVSLWSFANLGALTVFVDDTANDITGAVFTAAVSVNPTMPGPPPGVNSKDAALNYAGTMIFQNVAMVPWCLGQFGSLVTCQEEAGPDGVYGSKWLAAEAEKRDDYVDALPKTKKEWMQGNMAMGRVVVALVALIVALVTGIFLLLMGGLIIFWQIWAAILLAVFPFVALLSLWPGASHTLKRWFGKLIGALFMKLGLGIVLAVVLAFSSALWALLESWPVAVFLQMALTAGIVINRHMFTGLVLGFADAGMAMAGQQALDQKPTGGLVGGIAADAVRRGARDWMIGSVARGAGWVSSVPQRRRDAKLEGLAEQSLMGRYAEEKRVAKETGRDSYFVNEVQDRLQRGEKAFTPQQLREEKERLQAIQEQGGDPRRALLRSVTTDDHNSYTQAQQSWEQEIGEVRKELNGIARQYRPMAQRNVDRRRGMGRIGSAVTSWISGARNAPEGTQTAGPSATEAARQRRQEEYGQRRHRFEVRPGGRGAASRGGPGQAARGGSAQGSGGAGHAAEQQELRQAPHMVKAAGAEHQTQPQAAESQQPYGLQNAPIIKDGKIVVSNETIAGRGGETEGSGSKYEPVQRGGRWYAQQVGTGAKDSSLEQPPGPGTSDPNGGPKE